MGNYPLESPKYKINVMNNHIDQFSIKLPDVSYFVLSLFKLWRMTVEDIERYLCLIKNWWISSICLDCWRSLVRFRLAILYIERNKIWHKSVRRFRYFLNYSHNNRFAVWILTNLILFIIVKVKNLHFYCINTKRDPVSSTVRPKLYFYATIRKW